MAWYAAHIIMYVRFKDGKQDKYPVWENIVLIEAGSDKEAWEKSKRRALRYEGDSRGSFTWEGRPATWVFAGIRKINTCVDPEQRPIDETEITYSEFGLTTAEDLRKLVDGEPVEVVYVEQPPRM